MAVIRVGAASLVKSGCSLLGFEHRQITGCASHRRLFIFERTTLAVAAGHQIPCTRILLLARYRGITRLRRPARTWSPRARPCCEAAIEVIAPATFQPRVAYSSASPRRGSICWLDEGMGRSSQSMADNRVDPDRRHTTYSERPMRQYGHEDDRERGPRRIWATHAKSRLAQLRRAHGRGVVLHQRLLVREADPPPGAPPGFGGPARALASRCTTSNEAHSRAP